MLSGLGHYKTFVFDEKSAQLAFLSDRDTYKDDPAIYKLYHWTPAAETATEMASGAAKGMPAGMVVSENGRPEFSKDGTRLFFGYAKPPAPEPAEDAAEPVKVDIWSWTDPLLQPMQKVQADAEKKRNYRAVVHLKDKRLVPLASEDMPDVAVNDTGIVALGSSDVPYRQLVSWDSSHNDYYAVNLQDGTRKKLLEKSRFAASLSPGGTYVLTFNADDSQWYTVRVSDGVKTNLTAKLGVRFDDESSDTPEPARAYGSAGWTSGDRSVLLYDKYDIWEVRPDGTDARLVTGGAGRKAQIVFRYVRTDPEERIFPADKPFLLSAVNDVTKATGYYRVTPTAARSPRRPRSRPGARRPRPLRLRWLRAMASPPGWSWWTSASPARPEAEGRVAGGRAAEAPRCSSRRTPTAPSSSPRRASRSSRTCGPRGRTSRTSRRSATPIRSSPSTSGDARSSSSTSTRTARSCGRS